MSERTAGLSLKEAAAKAEAELALSEESTEADTSVDSPLAAPEVEQPAVENTEETGLFDSLRGEEASEDQPLAESYEVVVNGETQTVSLEELRSGYMRQADYTQKTQELATQRGEAERALTLVRALEEQPVETIKKLYQRINSGLPVTETVEANLTTQNSEPQDSPLDVEALVEARVAEMLENDPRLQALQQERALDEVNAIFADIEEMYQVTLSLDDKQLVIEKAQEMGTTDLRFVFGGLMNEANQRKLAAANAKRVAPTRPAGNYELPTDDGLAPATPKKYDSFRAALREQLESEQA